MKIIKSCYLKTSYLKNNNKNTNFSFSSQNLIRIIGLIEITLKVLPY